MIRLFRAYCFCFAGLVALWYTLYLLASNGLIDATGDHLIGRDFVNYYSASKLILTGMTETLLQVETYRQWIETEYGLSLWLNWSYPPHYLFFVTPLAGLPYLPAYIAWVLGGACVFFLLTRFAARPAGGIARGYLPFALAAPAVVVNAVFGQNGFITGTLLYLGIRFAGSRPIVAGICLGALTTKPQLGLLIPVFLLLRGHWAAIGWASLSAATLIGASALVFGPGMWTGYFEQVLPYQRTVAAEAGGLFLEMMPTAFAFGRLSGLDASQAMLLQAPFSLLAIALTIWTFRQRETAADLERALLLVCIFMVSPYAFNYDMTALLPAVFLVMAGEISAGRGRINGFNMMMAALYLLPLLTFFLPVGPVVMAGAALWIASRISDGRRVQPEKKALGAGSASCL